MIVMRTASTGVPKVALAKVINQGGDLRTVLLNLPNQQQVFRRYMCSYNSPTSLFPPSELMALAAIVKCVKHGEAIIFDAIAEKASTAQTIAALEKFRPEMIVSLTGFEIFEQDMRELDALKEAFPDAKVCCFGHYPTLYPKETFSNSKIDFILMGEPDETFSELYDALAEGKGAVKGAEGIAGKISGIAYRTKAGIKINPQRGRIKDIDALPMPAHELLNLKLYSETMVKKPFTVLHTTRGCPYPCNYCVHTYGREMYLRSSKNVLDEIEFVVRELGVRGIRFFDDTFNIDKKRLKEICLGIKERNLKFEWTCFSRVNTLDRSSLQMMKKAGCIRMFIGIESGSQRMLDFYEKGYNAAELKEKIAMVRAAAIEATGFFMVGPEDKEADFRASVGLAKSSGMDYVLVASLVAYPGTPLFEKMRNSVEFSLFPHICRYKDAAVEKRLVDMERRFYREFYFRPLYVLQRLRRFLLHPIETAANLAKLTAYVSGITGGGSRRDYY